MLTEFPKGRPPGPWPPDHGSGRQLPRGQVGAEERRYECGDRERGQNNGPVLQRDVAEVVAARPAPLAVEGYDPDDGRLQRQPQRDGAPSVGGGLSAGVVGRGAGLQGVHAHKAGDETADAEKEDRPPPTAKDDHVWRSQLSIPRPRRRANSRSLSVTTVQSTASAWAAINMSLPPIGLPARHMPPR